MERNEKDHREDNDQEVESERTDLFAVESAKEPEMKDEKILEEYDKRRREGKIEYIQSILEGILFRMGVEAKVMAGEAGGDIQLEISGDSGGLLIGKHGRTLDALQYVLNRIYQKRFEDGEKVFVDAENYRKRRVEALENLALRLGEKVKRRRRAVVAGVFNSRDRRIIHMTLKGDGLLETMSMGEG
ncbi:MAG: KH domain-containing protein, partial [Candidatus Aminicenantes bacterium]|nr:KH domain-containing protein [Candidatus Aminicenantes bacterium]